MTPAVRPSDAARHGDAHVAIIMDGNGRWAERRGLPRPAGHAAGAKVVRRIVEAAARCGLGALTLYAFSSDNWTRPRREVNHLMRLLRRYLVAETQRCVDNGIRLAVIGRRDRLAPGLVTLIERSERHTAGQNGMLLRLAVDYSATDAIASTAGRRDATVDFARALCATVHSPTRLHRVDLLIRTGGEQRLSDFMLWECAYAELLFTPTLWPDYDVPQFVDALAEYRRRQRRFGGLAAPANNVIGLPR